MRNEIRYFSLLEQSVFDNSFFPHKDNVHMCYVLLTGIKEKVLLLKEILFLSSNKIKLNFMLRTMGFFCKGFCSFEINFENNNKKIF